ncbi:MAG: DUF2244 domain-containing protein [Pseudomonadota bacterium]
MTCFELKPNNSLDADASALFYGSLVVTGGAVALVFALQGFWPILPFAGIELGALLYCVHLVNKRARDRDWIEIDDHTVTVRRERGGSEVVRRFQRAWTRVRPANGRTGLSIGASNDWCTVGEFLTDAERDGLGRRLREVLAVDPAPTNRAVEADNE